MTNLMARIPGPPRHGGHASHGDATSLVAAAADGDVVAQERLWRGHVTAVHRVCASLLSGHDAEDAVAETFLAAFASGSSFDPARGGIEAWLLGIAVNQVRRRWRADRRLAATVERLRDRAPRHVEPDQADHADAVIERADALAVRGALARLAPTDRLLLVTQAAATCPRQSSAPCSPAPPVPPRFACTGRAAASPTSSTPPPQPPEPTMHDDRPTTRATDDRAAAARIREALPAPDAAAVERIAEHIAAGVPRPARAARRRRRPVLRPALAAGAVATAAAIALLAPGSDEPGREVGLLALGPDAAAADVLRAAGRQATDADWKPLVEGEYHYVRSTFETPDEQATRVSERWTASDGTTISRESIDGRSVADGEPFWMPAQRCMAGPTAGAPPNPPGLRDYNLAVGSTPPSCWQQGMHDPLLKAATGRVVAAPPHGAAIYVPSAIGGPVEDRSTRRFGEELHESDAPPATPDAPMSGRPAVGRLRFPSTMPVATTWIEVEPRTVVTFETTVAPGALSYAVPVGIATWPQAFTMEELRDLPTTADGMVARLQRAAAGLELPQPANGIVLSADDDRYLREEAMLTLAFELLATAPIPPDVRRATFEALAVLRTSRRPSTVLRDEQLQDGRAAIGIRFDVVAPPGFEAPEDADDHVVLLLDAETAHPAEQVMQIGSMRSVVRWEPPRRVDSIE